MAKRTRFLSINLVLVLALAVVSPLHAGRKKEMRYAVSLAQKGLWSEAAHRFRLLAREHPNDPRLWNNLAVAYEAARQYEEASRAYEKAAALGARWDEFEANREAFDLFYAQWKAAGGQKDPEAETPPEEGSDAP